MWGGPKEQAQEQECGNTNAKDWHDEALKVIEKAMADYWQDPNTVTSGTLAALATGTAVIYGSAEDGIDPLGADSMMESKFDWHCHILIVQQSAQSSTAGGWAVELCRYLSDLPAEVTKDTDII